MPFLLLECPGFAFATARHFVANLDEELPKSNPYAMGTLVDYLGTEDLTELKTALASMLDSVEGDKTIAWNSNARDEQILGQAKHHLWLCCVPFLAGMLTLDAPVRTCCMHTHFSHIGTFHLPHLL